MLSLVGGVLLGACARVDGLRPDAMPVHPPTGVAAVLMLRSIDHLGYSSEPRAAPAKPLQFAAWLDGTILWTDSTLEGDPTAYRITRVAPAIVEDLVRRARARFDTLPEREMGLPFAVCSSGTEQRLSLQDGPAHFRVSWGGDKDTPLYPIIAPVWRDVRMMLDAAIPATGDVIAFDSRR